MSYLLARAEIYEKHKHRNLLHPARIVKVSNMRMDGKIKIYLSEYLEFRKCLLVPTSKDTIYISGGIL